MKKFYFSPQVPYLYRLHDKKIIKIQDIKISHLGTFKTLKIETFIFYLLTISIFIYVFFIKLVVFSMQRQCYSNKHGIRPIKSFKMRKISK
jgi:hypothetical protein